MSPENPAPVRLALVGTRGFGRVHVQNLRPLIAEGRAELVGVVDVAEPEADITAPWFLTLAELLAGLPEERKPEVVIIATPITTHTAMALEALAAGCHVALEKPPVRSLAEHWRLLRAAREAGRAVQVGFQARGGGGIDRLRGIVRDGELGEVLRVTAHGAWQRDRAYYARSRWAGLRRLGGERVADGVATNPLAHAVHAALTVAGIDRADQIASVTAEMRRAHDIEADDTTYLGIVPVEPGVPPVHCALVTTAPVQEEAWIEVVATRGRARLYYTADRAEITPVPLVPEQIVPAGVDPGDIRAVARREEYGRASLVENLLRHARDASVPLICPLESTSAFTAVLDATQSLPDPAPIGAEHVTWVGEGAAAHPVVEDIETWMHAALEAGAPFAEVGAPWGDAAAVRTWSPPPADATGPGASGTGDAA
ncbi:Gfo/Idh/MocA family protein [Brachybacterium hainanense]|uniref:Gfo/Idh/MocA family protein n=1 Tax=Brachybacterium hainanense TaxID=1541174 RepID=A0ABV6R6V9_9MICO